MRRFDEENKRGRKHIQNGGIFQSKVVENERRVVPCSSLLTVSIAVDTSVAIASAILFTSESDVESVIVVGSVMVVTLSCSISTKRQPISKENTNKPIHLIERTYYPRLFPWLPRFQLLCH